MNPLSNDSLIQIARFAVHRSLDAVIAVTPDGAIGYANEAAARLLSREGVELAGASFFAQAPELNADLWRELWKEIRARGTFAFEFALQSPDRQALAVEMTAHHLQDGAVELGVFFIRDIQARRRLEVLQQELISTVSHELRTPMTIIREGIAQVIDGLRGEINDSQKRSLSIALTGIDRLGRIIDELLDVSKIESGKVALRRERIDVAALARETAAAFGPLAQDRKLDLRVSTPAGPVWTYADHDRLVQVFHNLLGNAFKFTERGSIEILIASREGAVEGVVADTGIGMAPADAPRVFDKFEQLGRTAVTGERGTGLGLAICRGLIELHGGRIHAESQGPGKGSRFVFTLPRRDGAQVFREQVTSLLKEIAARGGSLSTIRIQLTPAGKREITPSEIDRVLEGLEHLVRRHSGRRTDLMVKGETDVWVALPSTIKREAQRVADRIARGFEEALAREHLQEHLRATQTLFGFPEDGPSEAEFLARAFPDGEP